MAWIPVAKVSQLSPGSVTEVMVNRRPYALCNVDGEVRALSGICVHRGGPLGHGTLHDGRVVCPFHMWEFDCRTGEYDYDPTVRIPTFEVKVEGEEILLQVPDRA